MEVREMVEAGYASGVNVALKYFRNQMDAEDVVQEAAVRILSLNSTEEYGKGFFVQTVKNLCVDLIRRNKIRKTNGSESLENIAVKSDDDDDNEPSKSDIVNLMKAEMDSLPASYRQVLNLRYNEGLSTLGVAQKLSISHTTARQRIFRAISLLRKKTEVW